MAPDVDRDRGPDHGVDQQRQGPRQLPGHGPVDHGRVEEQQQATDPEDQAQDLVPARPHAEEQGQEHRDPQRHRVDEHGRAPRRHHLEGDVHDQDAHRDLPQAQGEHDRQVGAGRQPEPALPGEQRHHRDQRGSHAKRRVRERRHVVQADLDHDPVDAPDEGEQGEQDHRRGVRVDGGPGGRRIVDGGRCPRAGDGGPLANRRSRWPTVDHWSRRRARSTAAPASGA